MRIGIAGVGRIGALHAANLAAIHEVEVVLADVDPARAQEVAAQLRAADPGADIPAAVISVEGLYDAGLDGLVVASSTDTHAGMLRRALLAGLPVFCEKPVSQSLQETVEVAQLEHDLRSGAGDPAAAPRRGFAQIGFQRRFDTAYRRARDAIAFGRLGTVHSIRAATLDNAPPPASYVAVSGGIFADCCIHDFDVIRYLSRREVVAAVAAGGAVGPAYIAELGDAPTVAGVLTLDDGALVSFAATRVNGYGHDVRTEIHGTTGDLAVGLFDGTPLRSAEKDVAYPAGPPVPGFLQRFRAAYAAELAGFVAAVRSQVDGSVVTSACSVRDGLEALRIAVACETSRRERRAVALSEIPGMIAAHAAAPVGDPRARRRC